MITQVLVATEPGAPAGIADHIRASLGSILPAVPVLLGHQGARALVPEVSLSIAEWRRPEANLTVFDERVDAAAQAGPFALRIEADGEAGAADSVAEILTRYQRFARRENAVSMTALFKSTLEKLHELYDIPKPLVKADYDHAIDTWQWVLRLNPSAGAAVQLAALFHDVERLISEADERIEHRMADYEAFKNKHAAAGAAVTQLALSHLGWDKGTLTRTVAMVEKHERPDTDPDLALLNDADSLSFFSLNSWGFLNYYGVEHTARKIAYTLRRMRPSAQRHLRPVRYHPQFDRMLREALAGTAAGAEIAAGAGEPRPSHKEERA